MSAPQVTQARAVIQRIANSKKMNEGIRLMRERQREFSSPLAATLSGIAVVPEARNHLESELDAMWEDDTIVRRTAEEVVVGGGLHAAIYCAVRRAKGFPRPLVIEQGRVGGAFAMSHSPSFYLNSRNRPGDLSIPGRSGALNVLPMGSVQPADLSGAEYPPNTDLAFCIRATLALTAHVQRDVAKGINLTADTSRYRFQVSCDKQIIETNRIIVAPGLGQPTANSMIRNSRRTLTFPQLMKMMDSPFPLRGMQRVAVVGAGDSGKTAVEALLGQGPASHWSVAALDWPQEIDWWGVSGTTCLEWEAGNRSRYKGLGRFFPRTPGSSARIRPITQKVSEVRVGFGAAYVDEVPYNCVVYCLGYPPGLPNLLSGLTLEVREVNKRPVALEGTSLGLNGIFLVGPRAQLTLSQFEVAAVPGLQNIPENQTALFRYADRTASLAESLGPPEP